MTPALFAVLLASTVNAPAPPDEAIKAPQGLPPTQVIASVTKDGEFEITQTRLVATLRTEERAATNAGKPVKYTVTVRAYSPVQETRRIKSEGVKVYTAAGKEVSAKDAADKLKKPTIVLLAADGNKVDPFYLKIIKPDTLVLVAPPPAAPPGAGPKPPAGGGTEQAKRTAEEAARAADEAAQAAKRDEAAKEAARAEAVKRAAEKKPN